MAFDFFTYELAKNANRFDTMPTAAATYVGDIFQYMGTTTSEFTHGYFYECKSSGSSYAWERVNVQPSGGSGGTSDYNDLSNRPTINGILLAGNKTTSDLGIAIPSKVSELTNDSNFATAAEVNTAVKSESDRAVAAESVLTTAIASKQDPISAGEGISITGNAVAVNYDTNSLGINSDGKLYVTKEGVSYTAGLGIEISDENEIKIDEEVVAQISDVSDKLAQKQNKLTAGAGISISDLDVISATGGTYSAGTGIVIEDSEIAVDQTYVATKSSVQALEASKQDKLTAGSGISISSDNIISATGGGAEYTAGTGIAISSDNVISVNNVPASSIIYTKATTVTTTIGGLKAGLNLQNRTLENIIERLVGSYTPPSFTSSSFGGSGVIINQRTQTSGNYVMGDTAELQSYTVTLSKGTDFNGLNSVVIKSNGNTIYTLSETERASLVNLGTVTMNFTTITQTLPASSTSGSWVVSATANYSKKSYDENEQIVYNNVDMAAGSSSISAADADTYSSLYYGAIPTSSTIKNISPSGLATLNDDTTIQLSRKNTLGSTTITTQTGIDKAIFVYAGTLNDIKIYATSDIANWDVVQQNLSYTRVNDTTYTKQFKIYTQVIAINTFDYTLS